MIAVMPPTTRPAFELTPEDLPYGLGDGLVLRFAEAADREPLAQFNGRTFGVDRFDEPAAAWTRDFLSGEHSTGSPSDVTLVEDARTGKIVSAMVLIPQTWTYAGIPFGVGRPETVATDPEYRRRGLVRRQFEVLHARSAAMGHVVQGITGIPWYYRQFGYEYALQLGGGRIAYFDNVPALKEGETEAYRLRPMTTDDIPFVAPLYERDCARSLVACPRSERLWSQLLTWYSPASFESRRWQVVENTQGSPVGYFALTQEIFNDLSVVGELAVVNGQSLRAVMPTVLRALKAMAQAEAEVQKKDVKGLYFPFGREHPVYAAVPECLPKVQRPYGWYIRVADVPGFLRLIAPALEARLAESPLAGHTGELRITEYVGGFRLVFESGRLATAEGWPQPNWEDAHVGFPPLVFLQLVFGLRALAEVRTIYADCWAKDEATALLEALFPTRASCVIPVG